MDFVKLFIIPLSIAILGYVVKQIFDMVIRLREKRFQLIERQLHEFFWPIYIRLYNNNAVWTRILNKDETDLNDKLSKQIGHTIEQNVIVQNHREIEDIIKSSIHIAFPDDELIKTLKNYLKHVEIYKALHDSGVHDVFPGELDAAYPHDFMVLIAERTFTLQEKLNKVYRIKSK